MKRKADDDTSDDENPKKKSKNQEARIYHFAMTWSIKKDSSKAEYDEFCDEKTGNALWNALKQVTNEKTTVLGALEETERKDEQDDIFKDINNMLGLGGDSKEAKAEDPGQWKCPNAHWQIYVHIGGKAGDKQRPSGLKNKLMTIDKKFSTVHISPAANKDAAKKYVTKADHTLKKGPFNSDFKKLVIKKPLQPMEEEMNGKIPWWTTAIGQLKRKPHPRYIDIFYDNDVMNTWKSIFAHMLVHNNPKDICMLPAGKMWDMMEVAYNDIQKTIDTNHYRRLYIIDVPRGMDKKKCQEIWIAAETLKSGRIEKTKHKVETVQIARPHVWIFMNRNGAEEGSAWIDGNRFMTWEIQEGTLDISDINKANNDAKEEADDEATEKAKAKMQGSPLKPFVFE